MEYCNINNGMRLISEYKKESSVTIIGCLLPAGAMFENMKERGSALFLEHTLFQVSQNIFAKNCNIFRQLIM